MTAVIHELVFDTYAMGGQNAAVAAIQAERTERAQRYIGTWTTEYGVLNRLLTLWEGSDESVSSLTSSEPAQDWLAVDRVARRLVPRLALREDLLSSPFLELRMYATHPGRCNEFVNALVAALKFRERYSPCVCVWTTRERSVDVAVHLWAYESIQARMAARDAALLDPEWGAYRVSIRPMLTALQASLLTPVMV